MHIIKGDEPIAVEHPVFLIFGQPGICKTSLAYSAKDPLLLDFDEGAHRAVNRKDTLLIKAWASKGELDAYATIIPDTVGRLLDLMTLDIMEQNPRYARDGALTQQGWGVLKTRFRTWMARLRAMGKDVLLIAHQREEKDGDVTVIRPDIAGGSYGEVLKVADFVGFLYMRGRDRVLDFSPTDRWVGKNPAMWKPFQVPPVAKATTFMAERFDEGRAALGTISEDNAKMTRLVDDWKAAIDAYSTPDEINRAIGEMAKLPAVAAPQVKHLLADRAKALQFTWDAKAKAYRAPIAQPA
jgi:hypothetical protein